MLRLARVRATSTLFLILASSAGALLAAPPEGYDFLPLTEATRLAGTEHKPMLLYFGRYGCTTCRKMHAEVFTDAGLRNRLNKDFVLAYVDTESAERITLASGERITEMQFAARNRILGTPTFVFFSAEQKPLFSKAGFQDIALMQHYGDYVAEGYYLSMSLAEFLAKP
jgi:thioredoxin-related protein